MADFLTTKRIASDIEDIIKKANKTLYIVTPYLRLSSTFYERLSEAIERGVEVSFIYGKTDMSPIDQELIDNLNLNVYYKDNLHVKCYANEEKALVTSMNLHTYSEANNRELGILIDQRIDVEAYNECIGELKSILLSSKIEKSIKKDFEKNIPLQYETVDFVFEWGKHLKKRFRQSKFSIQDKTIHIEGIINQSINLSNEYGFITLSFYSKDINGVDRRMKKHFYSLSNKLDGYRLYWNPGNESYPSRICLYEARDLRFDKLEDKVQYCTKGLDTLLKALVEIIS